MADNQLDIDSMSKEELNNALANDLAAIDGKEVEAKTDINSGVPENKEDPQPKVEEPPKDKVTDPNATDPNAATDEGKNDNKTKKRIEKLIARSRKSAALTAKPVDETPKPVVDASKVDSDDPDNIPDVKVDTAIIDQRIDQRLQENNLQKEKIALDRQELDDLVNEYPGLTDYKADIEEQGKKFPDVSFYDIARMLVPIEDFSRVFLDQAHANKANANKMTTGGKTPTSLTHDTNPSEMSDKDLKAHLDQAIASGEMQL